MIQCLMAFIKAKKVKVLWLLRERAVLPKWAYTVDEWEAINVLPPLEFVKIIKRVQDG